MAERLNIREYEDLFKTHYTKLCFFAFDFLGDIDLARDVVSDVFVQLWNEREQIKDLKRLKNFLFVCVRNKCINETKKIHHTVAIDEIDERSELLNMEWLEAQEERIAEMNSIIDQMSTKTQRVLQECYFNNHTYKETADMLGISADGVKKHIVKAFAQLRPTSLEGISQQSLLSIYPPTTTAPLSASPAQAMP